MTFDKSKVYTSLNAEELEVGSEVILANYLESLKDQVEANSWPTYVMRLDGIMGTNSTNRFKSGDQHYNLAYLVRKVAKEEEQWIVYLARYPERSNLCCCAESYWEKTAKKFDGAKTKLFIGTEDECANWCLSHQRFAEVIKAWEDGKQIQLYNDEVNDWECIDNPQWALYVQYRVKPEEECYVAYIDHYEPCLDFGSCAQWNKIQEYKGAKNKLFVGNQEECRAWCDKRDNLAKIILAWENGKQIQYWDKQRGYWFDVNEPTWNLDKEYRVKPNGLVWTDLKMGDILRRAGERLASLGGKDEYVYVEERRMVTGIVDDSGTKRHVQLGGDWIDDDDLEKWSVEE